MAELHETMMGQRLIQGTLPDIAKSLKRIADNMDSFKDQNTVDYEAKWKEAIHFIEMTEALTYDEKTQKRIGDYLIKEGIWKPKEKKDASFSTESSVLPAELS